MTNRKLTVILREFRQALGGLYGSRLSTVMLFGSQARNEADPDSDIDVLVVLRGSVDPGEEIARVSSMKADICLKHDVVISCVYVSEEEFGADESPLMLNVRREGVRV